MRRAGALLGFALLGLALAGCPADPAKSPSPPEAAPPSTPSAAQELAAGPRSSFARLVSFSSARRYEEVFGCFTERSQTRLLVTNLFTASALAAQRKRRPALAALLKAQGVSGHDLSLAANTVPHPPARPSPELLARFAGVGERAALYGALVRFVTELDASYGATFHSLLSVEVQGERALGRMRLLSGGRLAEGPVSFLLVQGRWLLTLP